MQQNGEQMIIAVASGKGGTGKTTVAVNLALSLSNVQVLDCDVEEPNSHIFLNPVIEETKPAYTLVPRVNYDLCDYCGKCAVGSRVRVDSPNMIDYIMAAFTRRDGKPAVPINRCRNPLRSGYTKADVASTCPNECPTVS
uniref:Iron-sulfur cluster carrier protein n=1 Tax=Candidatus Methanophaga sp. ANME-1 ERB7 TaxID=2759913 RepID=A0A7G9Z540_9EURY|nr:iron-sulfur cluster carrier protein [Methanosarcinales archaeon ANME-1 ERB7]